MESENGYPRVLYIVQLRTYTCGKNVWDDIRIVPTEDATRGCFDRLLANGWVREQIRIIKRTEEEVKW